MYNRAMGIVKRPGGSGDTSSLIPTYSRSAPPRLDTLPPPPSFLNRPQQSDADMAAEASAGLKAKKAKDNARLGEPARREGDRRRKAAEEHRTNTAVGNKIRQDKMPENARQEHLARREGWTPQ